MAEKDNPAFWKDHNRITENKTQHSENVQKYTHLRFYKCSCVPVQDVILKLYKIIPPSVETQASWCHVAIIDRHWNKDVSILLQILKKESGRTQTQVQWLVPEVCSNCPLRQSVWIELLHRWPVLLAHSSPGRSNDFPGFGCCNLLSVFNILIICMAKASRPLADRGLSVP